MEGKGGDNVNACVCLIVCAEVRNNHMFQQARGEDKEPNRWEHFCLKADQRQGQQYAIFRIKAPNCLW